MIELKFPDGSVREYPEGSTGRDVATSIAISLAKRAALIRLDGHLYDLDRALPGGGSFEILTREHPDVLEASVYGVPDERLGEEVGVAVVLKPGETLDADGLRAHCASVMAKHKVPRVILLQRPQCAATMMPGRDLDWNEALATAQAMAAPLPALRHRLYIGEAGEVFKAFHVLDGHGLKLLAQVGITPVIITGRIPALRHSATAARATSGLVVSTDRQIGRAHV